MRCEMVTIDYNQSPVLLKLNHTNIMWTDYHRQTDLLKSSSVYLCSQTLALLLTQKLSSIQIFIWRTNTSHINSIYFLISDLITDIKSLVLFDMSDTSPS